MDEHTVGVIRVDIEKVSLNQAPVLLNCSAVASVEPIDS
jgi:hypothetical protein